jgi:hypothetical protein
VQILDTSGDGLISFEEFVDWWVNKVRAPARRRPRPRASRHAAMRASPSSANLRGKTPLDACAESPIRKYHLVFNTPGLASSATHPQRKSCSDAAGWRVRRWTPARCRQSRECASGRRTSDRAGAALGAELGHAELMPAYMRSASAVHRGLLEDCWTATCMCACPGFGHHGRQDSGACAAGVPDTVNSSAGVLQVFLQGRHTVPATACWHASAGLAPTASLHMDATTHGMNE